MQLSIWLKENMQSFMEFSIKMWQDTFVTDLW